MKLLVINPGSTSTKVGVFEDETLLFEETLRHPTEEIAKYASVIDQKDFRKEIILDFLKEKNCDPKSLNVIVGRGGLLKPTGAEGDQADLYALAEKAGYHVVKTQAEAEQVTGGPVVIIDEHLADSDAMAYEIDRTDDMWGPGRLRGKRD